MLSGWRSILKPDMSRPDIGPQWSSRPKLTIARLDSGCSAPVTSQIKGYPFEVLIPAGQPISGAVLADQVKNLDWKARRATFCCHLPDETVHEILNKLGTLIDE